MQRLWILMIFILFTGCARLTPPPSSLNEAAIPAAKVTWQERKDKLNQLTHFSLKGKIAVQSKRDAGSASVTWKESAGQYFISLMGPFGSNSMKLTGTESGVTLEQSDGKTFHAQSAEALLRAQWGYQLPVSNLKYWVKGLPVPGLPANPRFDNENRLISLTQQGFQINYTDYRKFMGIALPTRLSLYSNTLRIKIIIYDWQIA